MPREYDPLAIEAKWQERWEEEKVYQIDLARAKNPFYNVVMFPYPSGDKLHVGHWYNFAPADSYGRFQRMQGKTVLEPMGFDAFGLPAENYAVKTGIHPRRSIAQNVETMIRQLKRMGCMYDWSKAVNTSAPEYYRWTQWLFLQMFKNGLAYRKEANVNFCSCCQTVLANEQAQNGLCDRCCTEVIRKPMTQWFWRITDYAEKLLANLDDLDWPEKTKLMQRNWIGRSDGAEVEFGVEGTSAILSVFTTRPDTLFGATYMVLSPEHPLIDALVTTEQEADVRNYRMAAAKKTEVERTDLSREKTGVFTGAYAINPVNDARIPIWIADYVIMGYGTGAIMAVPAHDERDWAFANAFRLPIVEVVSGGDVHQAAFTGEGISVHSGFLDGLATPEAKKKMVRWLEKEKKGKGVVNYRLRDWSVSRQRYWGAPIPIVYDPEGEPHPVPEEHLPWLLPDDIEDFKPKGTAPLAQSKELKERTEALFGKGWTPEVDTMDTFVCSSFYQFMYVSTEGYGVLADAKEHVSDFIDPKMEKAWMPVDMYIGGAEHACMHLIYARFVTMALKDFGIVKTEEPFTKLVHQGVITSRGAKMSKSKGNVVSPDEFIERHGSDVFRMYLMFMGPFTEGGDWNDTGIKGIDRFVQRIWKLYAQKEDKKGGGAHARAKLHATIRKVTEDIEALRFNTAISSLMELTGVLEREGMDNEAAQTLAKLLAPLAPHLAEELWERRGGKGFIINQQWPQYDTALLQNDTVTIAVQVNGKVRGEFEAQADILEQEALTQARSVENVSKHLEGKAVKKAVYVPGKLVSLVV